MIVAGRSRLSGCRSPRQGIGYRPHLGGRAPLERVVGERRGNEHTAYTRFAQGSLRISEKTMGTQRRLLTVAIHSGMSGFRWTRQVPKNTFTKGFRDGWSSIRGNEPAPPVPAYSADPGENPYRAGVVRGVREASAKALDDARRADRGK
jgi:hypothetical protein